MAARFYGDYLQDKLVLPQKERYKNPKDHKCAWILWGISSVWLGVLLVTHTRNFARDLYSHDSVDTTFSTVSLRSPVLHICHYNSSLLDLVSVRAFVISGDDERYLRSRRRLFENCAEFIPENRRLTLGDTIYYDATWTCPVRRYFEFQLQRFTQFYEGASAKLALQSPVEFATSFKDGPGLRRTGGEMLCEMGKRLWTSDKFGHDWKHSDQAATVPGYAMVLLDEWFRLITLGNIRGGRWGAFSIGNTPSSMGCFGNFLSFSDAFSNQTEKTEVEQLTVAILEALKHVVNDEAAIAWFGSHMTNESWVGAEASRLQTYERRCHAHFLQEARVIHPQIRHASGFHFRFSLANYTDDKFAIRQEMTSPMRFGIHRDPSSKQNKPAFFRSNFHASGVARTWRWLDSFGGRRGADHADTDYLECFSIAGGAVTNAAKDEENRLMGLGEFDAPAIVSGDTFAGTRMAFTYMSGTLKEEVFRNSIDMDCVKFVTGLFALGWVLALSEKFCFKTYAPKHPKFFRWRVMGLGRYLQPTSDDVEMSALAQAESDALEAMEAMREAQNELQR